MSDPVQEQRTLRQNTLLAKLSEAVLRTWAIGRQVPVPQLDGLMCAAIVCRHCDAIMPWNTRRPKGMEGIISPSQERALIEISHAPECVVREASSIWGEVNGPASAPRAPSPRRQFDD